jgi:hypothetical protein
MGVYDLATQAAARKLEDLRGPEIFRESPPGYTLEPDQNLIPGIDPEFYVADLEQGDGSELHDRDGNVAKFCAAHSSSALAVNSFGPFRLRPQMLVLSGWSGFRYTQFEHKCPTGVKGNAPNLDFLALGESFVVGVESKFLEPLGSKAGGFAPSYDALVEQESDDQWRGVFERLKADPKAFRHLDAVQLVKHSLGLRHTFADTPKRVLLYVYWEPRNPDGHPEFAAHRDEVSQLSEWLDGSDVRFESVSYPALWEMWEEKIGWNRIGDHVSSLRERYLFDV